ncbi:membrane cofactor protein-like isoform X2 [Clarias gariepinus]|uniref:membrane cofactor protein-like isoform X2 n=1 Tax=Clarias gariepinus TaxID=13013 RepID=UPI00234C8216|nr:membrane cofactor protein-like isoform X2 [Clarias gariepinus]
MRDTPWYALLILLTFLMKVAEVQGQCGRPSVGENMVIINDVSNQTFTNGSTITFKCSTGYVPVISSASKTITCVGTEWTKLDLNCTKKSCGSLSEIPNGKYTYPDGNLFGATAVAECNEGYLLVGQKTRNCRENGWDGRDPVCEAVKCEPPPTIQNGTYDPIEEFYNYNQAVTYSCSKGYTLVGESTITCLANGSFPSPPQCLFVKCETPNITNAIRVEGKSPPYGYKDFVRYECNTGYTMEGTGYLVCDLNGWNPPPPKCITVKCEPPPTIQNGTYDPIAEFYNYNQAVTYSCSKGYTLVGESTITCLANGSFPSPPQCLIVKCETPNIANAIRVEGKSPPYGYKDFVRYECNKGYTMEGDGYLVCEVNGWNPRPPKCIITNSSTTSHPSYGITIIAFLASIVVLLGPEH